MSAAVINRCDRDLNANNCLWDRGSRVKNCSVSLRGDTWTEESAGA